MKLEVGVVVYARFAVCYSVVEYWIVFVMVWVGKKVAVMHVARYRSRLAAQAMKMRSPIEHLLVSGAWPQSFLTVSLHSPERVTASVMTLGGHFGSNVVIILASKVGTNYEC